MLHLNTALLGRGARLLVLSVLILVWAPDSFARNDIKDFPVEAVLNSVDGKAK